MTEKEKLTITADTLEDCLEILATKLSQPKDTLKNYKILKFPKKGLFGLFNQKCVIEYLPVKDTQSAAFNFRIDEALKVALDLDGFFAVDYKDGAAMLTVYPERGNGKPVNIEAIYQRLNDLGVINIDKDAIVAALTTALETAKRVGDWPNGEEFNSKCKIEISNDKMQAYLTLYPPDINANQQILVDDILKELEKNKVIKGIDVQKIKEILEQKIYGKKILIAQGQLPQNGADAYFKYYFNAHKEVKFIEKPDGSVDLREMNLIETIKKDALLCEKIEPTPGVDGFDVTGKILKAKPGDDLIIKNGPNTYLDASKQKVFAAKDGEPLFNDAGEVMVNEICKISGNVDYSTGNIDFNGAVVVEGRVEDNFVIKAAGDVHIVGNVGKSVIQSKGNVIVDGGIIGKDECIIIAEKNVYAKFIEHANIFARQDIICKKMIMHSRINAGRSIIVAGDRGALIGGIARAGETIRVNELGAVGAAITVVEVGIPPEIIQKINEFEKQIIEDQKVYNKIMLGIQTLEKIKEERPLNDTEKKQLFQLSNMLSAAENKINNNKNEIQRLKRNIKISGKAKIQVYDKLFANVHTFFGSIQRNFSNEERHLRLGLIDNKISILPFE